MPICDSADYANLVRQLATMKKADATELQLATMLSVIRNISDDSGIWLKGQDLALRTLRETDRLLDLIGQSHDDRLLMLHHKAYILATALIWQSSWVFCLSDTDELFHRVQTACNYIRDVLTLQQYEQSPELPLLGGLCVARWVELTAYQFPSQNPLVSSTETNGFPLRNPARLIWRECFLNQM